MKYKGFGFGFLAAITLLAAVGMVMAAAGTISNNGDGTWTYERTASETTWSNYVTYYTENWPEKYYSWLETTGGCVVEEGEDRETVLDACKTPLKGKQYLEDHLDEILNGEYRSEKQVWTDRQTAAVTGTLD